ncbi:MAG: peptide chain release factor N(5)-glutamine methyltransferase, partial [Longimicrobiales bacterium]
MATAAHTPIELARLAAGRLADAGIENARLDAELLLAHVLGLRRLDLYLQFDRPLTEAEVALYRDATRRRLRREPLQYITGVAGFRELTLRVDGRVLIPRPETELLVGEVLRGAGERAASSEQRVANSEQRAANELRALDIGTGSGAVALSLAREGGFAHVVATDLSTDALELARENAAAAGLSEAVDFREGALWDTVRPGERFDVVASNPPYVADGDRSELAPEVADWEPAAALFGGTDGLDVIRPVVTGAPARLRPDGLLALEVGAGQADAVAALLEAAGFGR